MIQKFKNNYWFGTFSRFALVAALAGIVHLASRPFSVFAHEGRKPGQVCNNYPGYGEYCTAGTIPAHWYDYIVDGWWQHILYFLLSGVALFVALLVLLGCIQVVCFIFKVKGPLSE